jgi:hypothetical protein
MVNLIKNKFCYIHASIKHCIMDNYIEFLMRLKVDYDSYQMILDMEHWGEATPYTLEQREEIDKTFRNVNVIEFEMHQKKAMINMVNRLSPNYKAFFDRVDFTDFDLKYCEKELQDIGSTVWDQLTKDEILLNNIFSIDPNYYRHAYSNTTQFKYLSHIHELRMEMKGSLMKTISNSIFEKYSVDSSDLQEATSKYKSHSLTATLKNFCYAESTNLFDNREESIIKRDRQGFITEHDYYRCFREGFYKALDEAQKLSKEAFMSMCLQTFKDCSYSEAYRRTDKDCNTYFEQRSEEKISLDGKALIDANVYRKWYREALDALYSIKDEQEDEGNPAFPLTFDDLPSDFFQNDGNEKYSGYNGYDDDAIDNAFDGDPEATWNVD